MDIMETYSSLSSLSSPPPVFRLACTRRTQQEPRVSLLAARSAGEPPFQEATKENVEGEEPLI